MDRIRNDNVATRSRVSRDTIGSLQPADQHSKTGIEGLPTSNEGAPKPRSS